LSGGEGKGGGAAGDQMEEKGEGGRGTDEMGGAEGEKCGWGGEKVMEDERAETGEKGEKEKDGVQGRVKGRRGDKRTGMRGEKGKAEEERTARGCAKVGRARSSFTSPE